MGLAYLHSRFSYCLWIRRLSDRLETMSPTNLEAFVERKALVVAIEIMVIFSHHVS